SAQRGSSCGSQERDALVWHFKVGLLEVCSRAVTIDNSQAHRCMVCHIQIVKTRRAHASSPDATCLVDKEWSDLNEKGIPAYPHLFDGRHSAPGRILERRWSGRARNNY